MDADMATSRVRRRERLAKIPWLGLSAFMLSLVMALINAYYALRGSEIVVRPLEEVLIYRDGEGPNSVAIIGVRVEMINTASSEFGDLLLDSETRVDRLDSLYPTQSEIEPVFTSEHPQCELGSRCHYLNNLMIIERNVDLLDIPGGSAKSAFLTFALSPAGCEGVDCNRIVDFTSALDRFAHGQHAIDIRLKFSGDGSRHLLCSLAPVDGDFLRRNGWHSMACRSATVTSDTFL